MNVVSRITRKNISDKIIAINLEKWWFDKLRNWYIKELEDIWKLEFLK